MEQRETFHARCRWCTRGGARTNKAVSRAPAKTFPAPVNWSKTLEVDPVNTTTTNWWGLACVWLLLAWSSQLKMTLCTLYNYSPTTQILWLIDWRETFYESFLCTSNWGITTFGHAIARYGCNFLPGEAGEQKGNNSLSEKRIRRP